jgi:hypothetical protein
MVKTICPFAGDRARRAERPVLTQGRALVAFWPSFRLGAFMPSALRVLQPTRQGARSLLRS